MSQPRVVQPGGFIEVVKPYGRSVKFAVLDANRVPTQGFSIDSPVRQNFRVLRHGQYSLLVLTDLPIDVRLVKDGVLVGEQRCDPQQTPAAQSNSDVERKARELSRSPRPFYISTDDSGEPLSFAPDPDRSVQERLALQLYTGRPMHVPEPLVQRPEPPEAPTTQSLQTIADAPSNRLCWSPDDLRNDRQVSDRVEDVQGIAGSNLLDEDAGAPVDQPALEFVEPELFDVSGQAERWAPSSGLLAIGIRMVQVATQGEPAMPPDGFDWSLVQLNTFEEHALVRANLLSRINPLPDEPNGYNSLGGRHPRPGNRGSSQRFLP